MGRAFPHADLNRYGWKCPLSALSEQFGQLC